MQMLTLFASIVDVYYTGVGAEVGVSCRYLGGVCTCLALTHVLHINIS